MECKLKGLKKSELLNISGGKVPLIPAGFVIWLANEIVNNWSDVKSGVKDAYNDVTNS